MLHGRNLKHSCQKKVFYKFVWDLNRELHIINITHGFKETFFLFPFIETVCVSYVSKRLIVTDLKFIPLI